MLINRRSHRVTTALSTILFMMITISQPLQAAKNREDPLKSTMWELMRKSFIGTDDYVFDNKVIVTVPEFAEDPMQVPIAVDASALSGVTKIISFADLNPIQHIFTFEPGPKISSKISLRFKVQQATPVRAAALANDGIWHIGSEYLNAAGGGCTSPSIGNGNAFWEDHLGEIKSRAFSMIDTLHARYKFKVIHPMDTGLASNIPEFYIEQVLLKTQAGDILASLHLSQPVSENPVITFDLTGEQENHVLWMRDNNGNEFEHEIKGHN